MIFKDEIEAQKSHDIAFYLKFEGLETSISSRNITAIAKQIQSLNVQSVSSISRELSFKDGIVKPSSVSFDVFDSEEIRDFLIIDSGLKFELTQDMNSGSVFLYTDYSSLLVNDIVYLNKETIEIISLHSSGRYIVTRAKFGSKDRSHRALDIVSDRPRFWLGRRVDLYAVNNKTGSENLMESGLLSQSPQFNTGVWSFISTDIMTFFNRKILNNFREQKSISATKRTASLSHTLMKTLLIDFTVNDVYNFPPNYYNKYQAIKVSSGDMWGIYYVYGDDALDLALNRVTISFSNPIFRSVGFDKLYDKCLEDGANLKRVYYEIGSIKNIALRLLLSDTGSRTNSLEYDVYGGHNERTGALVEDVAPKNTGAKIDSSDVNIDSFELIHDENIKLYVDEATPVFDIFKNEILWRAGGYIAIVGGKITFVKYSTSSIRSNLLQIGKDDIFESSINSVFSELNRVSSVDFECNYYPEYKFLKKVSIRFGSESAIYGDLSSSLSFKSRSLWIGIIAGIKNPSIKKTMLELQITLERVRVRALDSGHKIRVSFPFKHYFKAQIGSRLSITDDRQPSFNTTDLNLSGRAFEVVGSDYDPKSGTITADLEGVPTGVIVAPSCEVLSYNAGTRTITVNDAGALGDAILYESLPSENFPKTCKIRTWRTSLNFSTFEDNILDLSSSGSLIVLKNAPAINPVVGDIITILDGDDVSLLNDVGADVQDFGYNANSGLQVGAGSYLRDGARWG